MPCFIFLPTSNDSLDFLQSPSVEAMTLFPLVDSTRTECRCSCRHTTKLPFPHLAVHKPPSSSQKGAQCHCDVQPKDLSALFILDTVFLAQRTKSIARMSDGGRFSTWEWHCAFIPSKSVWGQYYTSVEKATVTFPQLFQEAAPGSESSRTECGLRLHHYAVALTTTQLRLEEEFSQGLTRKPCDWGTWQRWHIMTIQNATRPTKRWHSWLTAVVIEAVPGVLKHSLSI